MLLYSCMSRSSITVVLNTINLSSSDFIYMIIVTFVTQITFIITHDFGLLLQFTVTVFIHEQGHIK